MTRLPQPSSTLTDEEIERLEEPYVPHVVSGHE